MSPVGEILLPPIFFDVFRDFDVINNCPAFMPVSNGEAWGLATLSAHPVMITDFQYNAILPERWEQRMFFVQDKETMKWGALATKYLPPNWSHRCQNSLPTLVTCMPPIADEIYEDELLTDEDSTIFFMTRKGNKVGILTPFGYSDIVYDSYVDDPEDYSFRLIRDGNTVLHKRTFRHPSG